MCSFHNEAAFPPKIFFAIFLKVWLCYCFGFVSGLDFYTVDLYACLSMSTSKPGCLNTMTLHNNFKSGMEVFFALSFVYFSIGIPGSFWLQMNFKILENIKNINAACYMEPILQNIYIYICNYSVKNRTWIFKGIL